jgi:hypothetical protein
MTCSRTTFAGLLLVLSAILGIIGGALTNGGITSDSVQASVGALLAGLGLIAAKDSGKTGGLK